MSRFSRPVRISSTAANCPVRLIASRTRSGCDRTSNPLRRAVPPSGLSKVARMRTIVVLPAPLEPSSAKMLPRATSKSTPLRTCTFLKDFCNPWTWIATLFSSTLLVSLISLFHGHVRQVRPHAFEPGVGQLVPARPGAETSRGICRLMPSWPRVQRSIRQEAQGLVVFDLALGQTRQHVDASCMVPLGSAGILGHLRRLQGGDDVVEAVAR